MKLGLALGSGGSRGAAHIGALMFLEEKGVKSDLIVGCSMGAVVGGCYALGRSADSLRKEMEEFKVGGLVDISFSALKQGAIMRTEKFRKTMDKYFGRKTFADVKIPFRCVATDLVEGKTVVLGTDEKQELALAVGASATVPLIFKPVVMGDKTLVDGGLLCRVPVEQAFAMGADVVIAMDVLGSLRKGKTAYNAIELLTRTIEITDNAIEGFKRKTQKNTVYIEPDLGGMTQYESKGFDKAIVAGYNALKAKEKDLSEFLQLSE